MEEALAPGPNFNRPVKDLVYKDLLTNTFTQASHDRGIKTWRVSVSYPQCVSCGNKFRLLKVLPTKAQDYPYSVSLSGSRTRSLVSCAQRLCVSTAGLSRVGFTRKGGIGSIRS
jgi:hypothetical protein